MGLFMPSYVVVLAVALQLFHSISSANTQTCRALFEPLKPKHLHSHMRSGLVEPLNYLSSRVEILSEPKGYGPFTEQFGNKVFFTSGGKEVGRALLIRPLKVKAPIQDVSNPTLINNSNRKLFAFLGFEESYEPGSGYYISQIPDAKLFTYLKTIYNQQVSDEQQIHEFMGFQGNTDGSQ